MELLHKYRTIENPINGLIEPLRLKLGETISLPIPKSDATLSITLETLPESTGLYFYNKEKVLVLNCVIKRKEKRNVYLEFVDEKDFYLFMRHFKDKPDMYKPISDENLEAIQYFLGGITTAFNNQ